MPRRSNRHPKHRYNHSLESLCVLVQGRAAWESLWGGVEEGLAAYEALRDVPSHDGGRPLIVGSEVFFDYEPGVPSDLKSDATSLTDCAEEPWRVWDELEERRRDWLADNGFDDD